LNWLFEFVSHALNAAGSARHAVKDSAFEQMHRAIAALKPRWTYKKGTSLFIKFGYEFGDEEISELEDIIVQFKSNLIESGIVQYVVDAKNGRRPPVPITSLISRREI
jgi:hypothetical protein